MTAPSQSQLLTIAGVDPSGGAGILADIKAMSALGAYGTAVMAALTAQNTRASPASRRTSRIRRRPNRHPVCRCPHRCGQNWHARAETGDSCGRRAHGLLEARPLVLDPVMVAKSGDHLLEASAVDELRENLLPLATMLTPNLPKRAYCWGPAQSTPSGKCGAWPKSCDACWPIGRALGIFERRSLAGQRHDRRPA